MSYLPQHITIIMDGNGRWAKKRFLPRKAGHRAGVLAAKRIIKCCAAKRIPILSLFAFSSENWRRPPNEINFLMDLFLNGLKKELDLLLQLNVQLRFIGDRSRLTPALIDKIREVETLTAPHTGMKLLIAANYGGQWDISEAVRRIVSEIAAGKLKLDPNLITAKLIADHLSFADLPDPDFFIRTSGEQRISNFMLWQLAYTELYFTQVLWPDFDEQEFEKALGHYASRERRFGYSSDQLGELAC